MAYRNLFQIAMLLVLFSFRCSSMDLIVDNSWSYSKVPVFAPWNINFIEVEHACTFWNEYVKQELFVPILLQRDDTWIDKIDSLPGSVIIDFNYAPVINHMGDRLFQQVGKAEVTYTSEGIYSCRVYLDRSRYLETNTLYHELGHCLGLGHSSEGIMKPSGPFGHDFFLQKDQEEWLHKMYK